MNKGIFLLLMLSFASTTFAQSPRLPLIQCTPTSSYNSYSPNHTHGIILDFQTRLMEKTVRQNGASHIESRLELLPGAYGDGQGFTLTTGVRALSYPEYELITLGTENGILPGYQYADKNFGQGYFVTTRYRSSNGLPPPQGKNIRLIEMSRKQGVFCIRIERY